MISSIGAVSPDFLVANPKEAAASNTPKEMSGDFGAIMADMASGAVSSVKNADNMAVQGITGTASTREVVDAVMQAEQALQTSIAIRDKIVTAYLETSRMAI
jgi:flagellar hook-basal body complex protein FliE